ncbi:hypothetical protein SBP18_03640 [Rhodoferax ferrireducens]|uniref:hypothetical protein n=1 Tax=Rhodoferax ferrireducens TaxID=192843 RepID=UPI00298E23C7|nr:hypothetical protein [Rhodoferax ferrireducens]WPC67610.1 hypothetical protein SBP18_03640 [Rhodoferax ferrireducens]
MSLSSATLSAIQQAGSAAYAADTELKNAVKDYAARVNAAMSANPYGLGNDALFENWKVVARLSQTMSGIEEELKKVYRVASELIADDQPSVRELPALAAPKRPVAGQALGSQQDLTTTDVVVKRKKKTATPKTRKLKTQATSRPAKPTGTATSPVELSGNAAKLLQHLKTLLDANKFTVINQTVVGQATGIPLGSMTAAIKKLTASGAIMAGPAGSFKLADFHGA